MLLIPDIKITKAGFKNFDNDIFSFNLPKIKLIMRRLLIEEK